MRFKKKSGAKRGGGLVGSIPGFLVNNIELLNPRQQYEVYDNHRNILVDSRTRSGTCIFVSSNAVSVQPPARSVGLVCGAVLRGDRSRESIACSRAKRRLQNGPLAEWLVMDSRSGCVLY